MVVSIVVLGSLLGLAWWRAVAGPGPPAGKRLKRIQIALGSGIVVHAVHAAEEYLTGFSTRFPDLFGGPPMPETYFLFVNGGWLAIWLVTLPMLESGRRIWLVPVWFLAFGGLANLVAHPVMALVSGGYFPGLYSAPIAGIIGILLIRALR